MTTDAGDRAIVASCVHLAHAMGLVAVAEGVESPGERDALLALGCDQAQGYFFSRPVPADAVPVPGGVVGV
jgi:EAL domain-containing protein (putative c-di-GMP-specific phosphodiesterase class I)